MEILSARPNGSFATEPYEAGWAGEALAIVYVREMHGPAPKLRLQAQISADGVRWIDHPTEALTIDRPGGGSLPLHDFGNWLRVAGEISGGPEDGETALVFDFYWVLKS
jgi:hypothetical protein